MMGHSTVESVVNVSDLTRRFGARAALASVSLAVERGAVHGLVGANGAGKTTLIKHILGLLRAEKGSVRVFGLDPVADPIGVLSKVGYLSEEKDLPGWMRIDEPFATRGPSILPGTTGTPRSCSRRSPSSPRRGSAVSPGGRRRGQHCSSRWHTDPASSHRMFSSRSSLPVSPLPARAVVTRPSGEGSSRGSGGSGIASRDGETDSLHPPVLRCGSSGGGMAARFRRSWASCYRSSCPCSSSSATRRSSSSRRSSRCCSPRRSWPHSWPRQSAGRARRGAILMS